MLKGEHRSHRRDPSPGELSTINESFASKRGKTEYCKLNIRASKATGVSPLANGARFGTEQCYRLDLTD